MNRRGFITGLISFVAAPAIVRAGSLMPVKAMPIEDDLAFLLCQDFVTEMVEAYMPITPYYGQRSIHADRFGKDRLWIPTAAWLERHL